MDFENQNKIVALIEKHGGFTKFGKKLGVSRAVVHSWQARGVVPAQRILKHPTIFKGIKCK